MSIKTIEIQIFGRVQGVYFRQSAANFAKSLRLTGYAENLRDGSVKIIAQGQEEALEEFIKWCQRGSLLSKVEGMSHKWLEANESYDDFNVLRTGSLIKDQAKSFFNLGKKIKNELTQINSTMAIPSHVVIIPNGNRTWSRAKSLKPWEGYWHAQKNIENLLDGARGLNINHLTFWGFSTENWKRNDDEVKQLIDVFESTIDQFKDKFLKEKARFRHLGRKDRLPLRLINKIKELENLTEGYKEKSLNIAFDYGGRDEILRAVDTIIKLGKTSISEEEFSTYLDTKGLPDPDLIIRTAGEKRLSGIMPWQSVYAEFYTSNVYFPRVWA